MSYTQLIGSHLGQLQALGVGVHLLKKACSLQGLIEAFFLFRHMYIHAHVALS